MWVVLYVELECKLTRLADNRGIGTFTRCAVFNNKHLDALYSDIALSAISVPVILFSSAPAAV